MCKSTLHIILALPHKRVLTLSFAGVTTLYFILILDPMAEVAAKRSPFMVPERAMLHVASTALQFAYAGNHVFVRAALNLGVSKLVFPVYRNLIAMLLLCPFAYVLEKYV